MSCDRSYKLGRNEGASILRSQKIIKMFSEQKAKQLVQTE